MFVPNSENKSCTVACMQAGFLVRPSILTAAEIEAIRDQIYEITHEPNSLPPAHRAVPGGPASLLVDHPAVIGVRCLARRGNGETARCIVAPG